jgi:putative ABC transport system permease protein
LPCGAILPSIDARFDDAAIRPFDRSLGPTFDSDGALTMSGLLADLRFALRSLLRNPTFSGVAILTLALGIGANTAVFTLVDGVLLSPLPFEDSEELIAVRHSGREGADQLPMSTGLYALYREQASSIEEIGLYGGAAPNLVLDGEALRVVGQTATPSFFTVLGADAAIGRTFTEEEGAPDAEPVVILSDGLWRDTFGADPAVIGRTIDLNGTIREVVGVMPADFGHPNREARLWLPMVINPANTNLAGFGSEGVARLAPGATPESALTELTGLIGRLRELFPESGAPAFLEQVQLRAIVMPLKEQMVGDLDATLWILLGTVAFVMLIACANVANLLLVRAEARHREMAMRLAIGASRSDMLRASMSESSVLSLVGATIGVVVAVGAVNLSKDYLPSNLPRADEVGIDLRVLAFTASISLACALFFGLLPLLRLRHGNLIGGLREGAAHGATSGRARHLLRNSLVVVQMALALVLLVGSGLMLRSFQALRAVDPGFESDRVLVAGFNIPPAEIAGWAEVSAFYQQLGDALRAQPGVAAVGFGQALPLGGGTAYFTMEIEDHPRAEGELPVLANHNQVEPGFFEALGIDLLEGRLILAGDGAEGSRSTVVSESFAQRWWPGVSPLGRRVRMGPNQDWFNIVGVVRDAKYASLEEAAEEMVYWPSTVGPAANPQVARGMLTVIATTTDPLALLPVLQREAAALNARLPVSNPRTMATVVEEATSRTSFTMAMLGVASGIALLLGLIGIYGVVSYIVGQRTREIGVRMALGATAPSVRRMVVRHGLLLAAGGALAGLVAAVALSSVMASLLYGVSATDPLTYGAVATTLVVVSLVATWIPAARAAGVDPARALRAD